MSYIVNETLEGRGRYLKQYTIAVYGLGKPEDFSPGENPLVRVEAGRLRGLLENYYNDEGKGSSLRILLPKGSYQPEFAENVLAQGMERRKKDRRSSSVSKVYSDGIKILLGFKCYTPTPENSEIYYLIVRDFTLILNRFPFAKVLSASPNNSSSLAAHEYLTHIRTAYQADYLLKMDVEELNQRLNLKCLLLHTVTEEVVWGESFDIEDLRESRDLGTIYRKVANDLLAPDHGVAHQYRAQYLQGYTDREGNEHQFALLYLRNSYIGFTQRELQVALLFCEHRLAQHPHDAIVIFVNLHLCMQEFLSGYPITENLPERFVSLVRMALRVEPENAETRLFHAFAAYLQEDYALAASELEHALNLNNDSAFSQIFAGGLYYLLGEFEAGDTCISMALGISSRHSDWYHVLGCLSAYRKGDHEQALQQAKQIYMNWGSALRALLYRQLGRDELASREIHEMETEYYFLPRQGAWLTPDILERNPFVQDLLNDIEALVADRPAVEVEEAIN
ncbi:MAG: hypothetical protein R3E95_07825 [Thiolinea sp.]